MVKPKAKQMNNKSEKNANINIIEDILIQVEKTTSGPDVGIPTLGLATIFMIDLYVQEEAKIATLEKLQNKQMEALKEIMRETQKAKGSLENNLM